MVTMVNVTALKASTNALPWEGGYEERGVLESTKSWKKDGKGEKTESHSTVQSEPSLHSVLLIWFCLSTN